MNLIDIFSGAIGAGVFAVILKLIDLFANRNKTRADAAKVIVEGGAAAVKAMQDILVDYDKINDEQAAKIETLEKGREERTKLIADLQKQVEADLIETQKLRDEVVLLRVQVAEGNKKYQGAKKAIEKLVQALNDANIPVPDLNGDLTESVKGLKWPK